MWGMGGGEDLLWTLSIIIFMDSVHKCRLLSAVLVGLWETIYIQFLWDFLIWSCAPSDIRRCYAIWEIVKYVTGCFCAAVKMSRIESRCTPAPINSFMLLFINFSFQNLIWIRIAQIWWMECKTETFCANIMSISEIIFQENKNFEKASISEHR